MTSFESTDRSVGPVDRAVGIPLHLQLSDLLRQHIDAGVWMPGCRLPGEQALCQQAEVSRSVVRQAIGDLVNERILVRRHGIGTFVAEQSILEGFASEETGFYDDMVMRGHSVATRVVQQRVEPASAAVAEQLECGKGSPVFFLSRVRDVDGVPSVYVESWLSGEPFAELVDHDFQDASLYGLIYDRYGIRAGRSRRVLSGLPADQRLAKLLGIEIGAVLLRLRSVSFSERGGAPFECYSAYHRADRMSFELETMRPTAAGSLLSLFDTPTRREAS